MPAAAPGAPALIAQDGVEANTRFSLPRPGRSATIGRASTNDIPLSSAKLSRVQARIDCDSNGRYSIVDLNSLNGTLVNGAAARQPIGLSQGDTITVGDVSLVVDFGSDRGAS
jgi:pSer/pThr/pTyr-binding forkhead associated (FHA) protein